MPEANFISFPSNQIDENPEHLCEVRRPRYPYVTSPSPSALPHIFTLSPGGRGQGEGDHPNFFTPSL